MGPTSIAKGARRLLLLLGFLSTKLAFRQGFLRVWTVIATTSDSLPLMLHLVLAHDHGAVFLQSTGLEIALRWQRR